MIASLNKGLQLASCDLVARMDSDDIAVSTRLEAQYQFMLQHPEVSVCGGAFIYQEEPNRINTYPETHSDIVISSLYDCSLAHQPLSIVSKIYYLLVDMIKQTSMQKIMVYG